MSFAGRQYKKFIVFFEARNGPIVCCGMRRVFHHPVRALIVRGFGYAQPDAGKARTDSRFISSRKALA
jgi:hypothetical protein